MSHLPRPAPGASPKAGGTDRANPAPVQIALHTTTEGEDVVIHVSGSLTAAGVPLLRDIVAGTDRGTVIDLAELVTATPDGIAALRRFVGNGSRIRNASPYMALRLGDLTIVPEPTE